MGAGAAADDVHVPTDDAWTQLAIDRAMYSVRGRASGVGSQVDVAVLAAAAEGVPMTAGFQAKVQRRYEAIERDQATLSRLLQDPGIAQRTDAWYAARGTLITASDTAQALGRSKYGKAVEFLQKKCGYEDVPFNGDAPPIVWGVKYETVANMAYTARTGQRVHEFGLLRHPTLPFLGASPDGITEHGVMVEIKCPYRRRILKGHVPMQYYYQIQCQLEVTGLSSCDYIECAIREYANWQAFEDDASPCGRWTLDGQEHGAVVEVKAPAAASSPSYYHSPQGLTAVELFDWIEDCQRQAGSGMRATTYLYRIERLGVQRVVRDDGFLSEILPALEQVWDRVLAYRADEAAYNRDVRNVKEAAARKPRATEANATAGAENAISMDAYSFVDDDGEDAGNGEDGANNRYAFIDDA